ncbi:MAG: fibrobacter succinogenes major paralogous domain-containing protein [Ferruginibacter sp.]
MGINKYALVLGLITFQVFSIWSVQAQKKIKLGNQVWMKKNLNLDVFQNGDPILEVTSEEDWIEALKMSQPAWCYYDFNPSNGYKYGKLYNWYAVIDPRGLAPVGWRIPSEADWDTLINFLGKNATDHEIAHDRLKSNTGWGQLQIGKKRSGFNAKPGGYISPSGMRPFDGARDRGFWWSTTLDQPETGEKKTSHRVWVIQLNKRFSDLDSRTGRWFRESIWDLHYDDSGHSVRCIQNSSHIQ